MINKITLFFEKHLNTKVVVEDSNKADPIQLACAALMIELSIADQHIDKIETDTLMKILQQQFDLKPEELKELFTLAQQQNTEATSLYQFTHLINEAYGQKQKIQLIKNMWEIAYADGDLDRYEDHLIRNVADLIYVSHSDFIKTKLAVKQKEA